MGKHDIIGTMICGLRINRHKPISDYHMHTPLCGHASGQPEEYANHALKMGLKEIGFSDHAPFVVRELPGITMKVSELPFYHKMIEDVRARFKGRLEIRIGIEADFIPGYKAKIKAMLEAYPYDYVIGSVHFIKDWGFDDPAQREKWSEHDINTVYRDYHELLRASARTGFFNIIAHPDLVKKFGHRPTRDITKDIEETAKVFKETGVAVEINTSGRRKTVGEMYPALKDLTIYCRAGVPLTFGSDAHKPEEVACDFDKAVDLAKKAGYKEYAMFKGRKIYRTISF
ncbi:MAG: histidinol-phosphatase HisJ family protein [Candidatus Omnitrophica bacterium]|nr:histidinol-phosphatase HisJ family protein [Candidatus Omnitrophota bacterium]